MKIHHVGYLVKKIDKGISAFQKLGYVLLKDVVFDEYRQADICFLEKDGYLIELVSPTSKDSVVANLIRKIGNSPYHICYETNNMKEDIEKLLSEHYVICSEEHEAVAIDNRNVCFLIHPFIGMVELVEA